MAAGCNIGAHNIIITAYCQRKNQIFNTLLGFCLLWTLAVPAAAQVYKWVDEKGTTHYGERPPQGKKSEEIGQRLANPGKGPVKPPQSNWKEKDLEFRSRRIEAEQAKSEKEVRETKLRGACNQARDRLRTMKSARRMYQLNEKGERVYQSDEENRAAVAKLERRISERCRR